MIKWEDFANQFHPSWHSWAKGVITSQRFDKDFEEIKKESRSGIRVIPGGSTNNLFRCFRETPMDQMRVVVMGLSPYNGLYNGKDIADGLALSCSNTGHEQPSLKKWYDAMERGYGENVERDPDLKYLAQRGVLLYNVSLTTPQGESDTHVKHWRFFTEELVKGPISSMACPIIALGKVAQEAAYDALPWQKVYELDHPAYSARKMEQWKGEHAFKEIEMLLQSSGKPFSWIKLKKHAF